MEAVQQLPADALAAPLRSDPNGGDAPKGHPSPSDSDVELEQERMGDDASPVTTHEKTVETTARVVAKIRAPLVQQAVVGEGRGVNSTELIEVALMCGGNDKPLWIT